MVQVMIKNLEQVLSMILNSFHDPHPRVQWAAINAIGQLSTDLGPDLQVKFHHLVLPALAGAMDDFQNPRVQVCIVVLFIWIRYIVSFCNKSGHALLFCSNNVQNLCCDIAYSHSYCAKMDSIN